MNIDDILFVTKWGLNKTSKDTYEGVIKSKKIKVIARYKLGRVFLKEFIPNGYHLFIDDKQEGSKLTLREIDNIFNGL